MLRPTAGLRNWFVLAAILSLVATATAQVFTATYGFDSVTTSSGLTDPTAVPTAPNVTFGSFTAVGTPANPNAGVRFSFTNMPTGGVNGNDTYSAHTGVLNPAEYYSVTLTPQPGFALNLSGITFTIQRSATGIRTYAVRSNAGGDNFATNLPASINPANGNLSVQAGNVFYYAFDALATAQNGSSVTLTGATFQNVTTPITFRFYGWNAEASGGTFSIDNVVFTGTAVSAGGPVAPQVSAVVPSNGASNVAINSAVSVTFNEAVNVTGAWYALTGSTSGVHAATVSGGPIAYTLTPTAPFAGSETVGVSVFAAQVTDGGTGTLHPAADFSSSFTTAAPPTINTSPTTQTVSEGTTVLFTVNASGVAPLSYQWRKGGVPLNNAGNVSGATTDTLTLGSVTLGDIGSYDVVVTNPGGSTPSTAASLTVNPAVVAPTIATQPSAQSVVPGGTATFTVGANGTAPFGYQWYKGASPLADGGNISGANAVTLTVSGVTAADVANYSVVVSNSAGTATSNAASLTLAALVTPSGAISYAGGSYGQNFDSLPASGTFTLASNGPLALNAAPINAAGLGGWTLAKYSGTGTVALFRVDAGSGTSGSVYSYGSASAGDRALGSLSSGTTIPRFGVMFVNNTGQTITQFSLSYTGEQWRDGGGSVPEPANKLTFEYALGATDINNGTFVPATVLDFTAPQVTPGTTDIVLNGNTAANRVAVANTITGLNWGPGQTLVLRWSDANDPGDDDGLAIDDLTFSTPVTPESILPSVVYTTPADNSVNVPGNTALSVVFNEAVNFSASSFTLTGDASGVHTAAVSGGPVSYTLTPTVAFGEGETVTLTIAAAQVTDATTGTVHPPVDFTANFVTFSSSTLPIHAVQGSGLASLYVGTSVTVQGIVVASFQGGPGTLGGYYIEAPDAAQDSNPATSEGIYVFDNANSVTLGDFVTVTGTVNEFGTAPATETEISALTTFIKNSSGNPVPTATAVTLPFPSSGYAERYEGMLVTLPQTLTVNDNFDLGHFGEVSISNGRLPTPTNIVAPGAAAQAQEALNLLNQLILDDASSVAYPDPTPFLTGTTPATQTLRGGSTTTGVTGILDNRFGLYVIEPTITPTMVDANPRLASPASLGSLRVAIGNVENFMNGDGMGGGFPTSRGATTYADFQAQLPKVTAGILGLLPDIMGLTEVENDRVSNGSPDSYGPTSAIAQLVDSLNAHAPAGVTYAFVNASAVDIVTDLIHCAFIYRTDKVEMVGNPAMLNDPAFSNVARNPLAQTFREKATGAKLTVCINHFRAKGGAAPGAGNLDSGDGQGTNNALRVQEADALTAWLATDPTGSGDPDFLIIGDLNSYAKEDPITHLIGAGYVSLTERFEGEGGYSYAFNGEYGHLDHALATPSLNAQVLSAATWHVNSDEPTYYDYVSANKSAAQQLINAGTPYRYSDHDPVVIGVSLTAAPVIVTQPVSQTVTVGTSVTFSVAAIGNPAPTYQWRKGGIPIGSATSASFTIPSPVVADDGSYDVVVTNSVDSVTSTAAVLTVNPGTAGVTLGDLAQTYNGAPHSVSVSTTPDGLAVNVTYNGSPVPPTNAGSYAVVAAVNDVNYLGLANGTLVISPAPATVTLGSLSQVFDNTPKPVSVSTNPTGLVVNVTYNGSAAAPTNVGSYAVVATVNENNYTGTTSGTLVITAASATVELDNLVQSYDGAPKPVTIITTPAGLTVNVTYNGGATPPIYPGAYAVVATINDSNYSGTASDTLYITTTALVRHGPQFNGTVDGSVQVLLPESVTLNSSAHITGDLLMPGTPVVKLNGSPVYTGTIDSNGVATPTNHVVTLNSGSHLRHVVRRVNAIAMPTVSAPPAPTGTRNVTLNSAGQSPGDFATLRNLTLNSNAGAVMIPAGTYGALTANGSSSFVLGVAGATVPSVYNLQSLVLNGTSRVTILGPVIINLASGPTLNGSIGAPGMPDWLELNIASGGLTLNGAISLDGFVLAPNGTVTINGGAVVNGGVIADRLTINSNGLLNEP